MDLAGIKSQATKWACVVTALEDKGSRLVASKCMKSPNPGTQYKDLKRCLSKQYVDTSPDWWRKFQQWQVGQRSPLESVTELVSLGPRDHKERLCWIYKQMFLERCPADMRGQIMTELWTDPDAPDSFTDKAEEVSKQLKCKALTVGSVEQSPEKSVDSVKRDNRQSKNLGNKGQKSKTDKPGEFDEKSGLCYTHRTFGVKAYLCRRPQQCSLATKVTPKAE